MIFNIVSQHVSVSPFVGREYVEGRKWSYTTNKDAADYIYSIVIKEIGLGLKNFIFRGELKNAVFVRNRSKITRCKVKCMEILISALFLYLEDIISFSNPDRVLKSIEGDTKYRMPAGILVRIGTKRLDYSEISKSLNMELEEDVAMERKEALNQALGKNGSLELLCLLNERLIEVQKKYPGVYFLVDTNRPLSIGPVNPVMEQIREKRAKPNDLSALNIEIFRV
jgi:hypothetical protein